MQEQNYNQNQGNFQDYNYADEGVDLADFDAPYTGAEQPTDGYEDVPDGQYQARIEKMELTRSKKSNEPMIKWTLRIIGPTHQNRLLWRYTVIKNDRLGYIKKDLYTCGVELSKFSDLPKHFDRMLDTMLDITVQKRGEFQNIYLNRRVVTQDQSPGQAYNDDIPF